MSTVVVGLTLDLPVRLKVEARWNEEEGYAELVKILSAEARPVSGQDLNSVMTAGDLEDFDSAVKEALKNG